MRSCSAHFRRAPRSSASKGGTGLLRLGAREVISNPLVARDTLHRRELRALGHALRAVGQQHVAVVEPMIELAEQKSGEPSATTKARSGRSTGEGDRW
jgi:hypothetical protein